MEESYRDNLASKWGQSTRINMFCESESIAPQIAPTDVHDHPSLGRDSGTLLQFFLMKTFHQFLSIILLLGLAPPLYATDPAWWATRGVITQSPASNLSPATIGQAKWMVSQALAEMETQLDTSHYQTLKSEVEAVMDLSASVTQEDFDNQRKFLVIGQLRASAQPFYDILHSHYPAWLENQLAGNQTKDVNDSGNFYSWTTATTDDQNKALATVGQLKAVFSLRFEVDTKPNGLPDFWEYPVFRPDRERSEWRP